MSKHELACLSRAWFLQWKVIRTDEDGTERMRRRSTEWVQNLCLGLSSPLCTAGLSSLGQNNQGCRCEGRSWAGCCYCPESAWWRRYGRSCSESPSGSVRTVEEETCSLKKREVDHRVQSRLVMWSERETSPVMQMLIKTPSGVKHHPVVPSQRKTSISQMFISQKISQIKGECGSYSTASHLFLRKVFHLLTPTFMSTQK